MSPLRPPLPSGGEGWGEGLCQPPTEERSKGFLPSPQPSPPEGRGGRRGLATLSVVLIATLSSATELGQLTIQVDGTRADVGTAIIELTTYRVDLAKMLPELTDGHAQLKQTGAGECRILVDGKDRVRINLGDNASPIATVLPSGSKLALTEAPRFERTKANGKRIYIDVRALGQLTGASADVEGKTMAFLTPEWWAGRLGIQADKARGLNARSVGTTPDFGVTPPANTMLTWVRPAKRAYVQIYKGLADGVPAPMLATSPLNKRTIRETDADLPTMWSAGPDDPAQAPTQHIERTDGGLALYASVIAPTDPGVDPVEAINAGKLDDWNVVGMRQRILDSPITFRMEALRAGEKIVDYAKRTKMPVELVLALNGYGERSVPKAGTRLLVIDKVVPIRDRPNTPRTVGLYEVRPGETVDGLAQRWKVPPDAVCALNDLQESEDLAPGQVIFQVAPGDRPPTEKPKIAATEGVAKVKASVPLRETSSPTSEIVIKLPAGAQVSVCGKAQGGMTYVQYGGADEGFSGFVPTSALLAQVDTPGPVGAPNPRAAAIRQEALAHLGTPYNWGGNDISRGIDCSHFVAAVLSRSGSPAPPPPVSSQEQQGLIVHWKQGQALRGVRTISFPNSQYPGQPSLDRLQIGDRIIIQRNPLTGRVGSRHTGVYIGPYQGRFGNFKHAIVHAGSHGVAVVSITAMWKDYRYAVHDGARRVAMGAKR